MYNLKTGNAEEVARLIVEHGFFNGKGGIIFGGQEPSEYDYRISTNRFGFCAGSTLRANTCGGRWSITGRGYTLEGIIKWAIKYSSPVTLSVGYLTYDVADELNKLQIQAAKYTVYGERRSVIGGVHSYGDNFESFDQVYKKRKNAEKFKEQLDVVNELMKAHPDAESDWCRGALSKSVGCGILLTHLGKTLINKKFKTAAK